MGILLAIVAVVGLPLLLLGCGFSSSDSSSDSEYDSSDSNPYSAKNRNTAYWKSFDKINNECYCQDDCCYDDSYNGTCEEYHEEYFHDHDLEDDEDCYDDYCEVHDHDFDDDDYDRDDDDYDRDDDDYDRDYDDYDDLGRDLNCEDDYFDDDFDDGFDDDFDDDDRF